MLLFVLYSVYIGVLIVLITSNNKRSKMNNTKKQHTKENASADKVLTRHESWRNHRRHTGLKLIRFS